MDPTDHGPLNEKAPHHTSAGPGHQTVAEGDQGEQHHEKKSVFTKVKARAKKMKDSLTGHGHGLDEEGDEDDQEKFEDPRIHDSPKYDSAASKTTAGQVGNLGTSGVDHGRSTAMDVDPLKPNVKPGSNFHGQEGTKGQHKVTLGSVMGEDVTHASQNKPVTHSDDATTGIHYQDNVPSSTVTGDLPHGPPFHPPGISHGRDNVPVKGDVLDPPGIHHHSSRDNVPSTRTSDDGRKIRDDVPSRTTAKDNLERPKGQEEDFAAPKDSSGDYTSANYQSKVTDPTGKGGEAAGVSSILQSFENMKVKEGSEGMGKTRQEHNLPAARNEDHLPTSVAPTGSHDQFSPELSPPKPFTAGGETFDSTKPQEHDYLHDLELEADHRPSKQSSSYTDKISSPTTGIAADRAVSDKNVEASTLGYGNKDNTAGVLDHEGVGGKPSSEQSSYTEKISSATSAIADRAVSAKNLVALKLGYGETGGDEVPGTGTLSTANQQQQQQQRGVEGSNQEKGGGGIADRATSAKNLVASKLGYGEKDNTPGGHEVPGTGTYSTANQQQQQQQHGVEGNNQEKAGGGSVKGGYFAEKLKPGEEDKALSEVITESLHKRKPEQQQKQETAPRPEGEVISDTMHKQNDDPDGEVNSPMGKVTQSERVPHRLGNTKDDQALVNKGMVEKIKGAVGSWLGTGDQSPGSQGSPRSQPGPASDDTGNKSN
ncbi:hypothetical protein LWI29_022675 [Acer saccharum]|uniref:Uncharacterized protein n=1 Tax=Acer saccharum TaxID=4024 RepID=A0AA39SVY9_ACESA|nr:hypothetical protein LWI29_022675 [Acer saccharum]